MTSNFYGRLRHEICSIADCFKLFKLHGHVAAKIVPNLQNFEQTQHRMDIAQEMLTTFSDDTDLLKNVRIGVWL